MSEGRKKLSEKKKQSIQAKNNGMCVLCGRPVYYYNFKTEHLIPVAVGKWTGLGVGSLDVDENIFPSHEECNSDKGSSLNFSVYDLHIVNETDMDDFIEFYNREDIFNALSDYSELFNKMIEKHNSRCALCGRRLPSDKFSLRRINGRTGRTEENCCIVCSDCNSEFKYRRYRRFWV